MKSLVSNQKYISEGYRLDDLLGLDAYVEKLRDKIDESSQISLIGIVGGFGTGKSLMLEKYKSNLKKADHIWIHFDAWKYPDRHNLWEGFVLDFARQIDEKKYKSVLDSIDGRKGAAKKTLIKSVGALSNLAFPGSGSAIDKLTYFVGSTPAKRISDIQEIFEGLLEEIQDDIYIVAEDVDRSGESGVYFIETLNQFLNTINITNRVRVFVPVSDNSYNEKPESYIKSLDHIVFFNIGPRAMEEFVKKIFAKEISQNPITVNHLAEWFQRIMGGYGLTIRTVKLIIRDANIQFKALQKRGKKPDGRIVVAVETCKHFKENILAQERPAFSYMVERHETPQDTAIEHFLRAVELNRTYEDASQALNPPIGEYNKRIKFIDKEVVSNTSGTCVPFRSNFFLSLPIYYLD